MASRRILVVEDEYIVAADIAQELADAGFHVIGPTGTVEQALALAAQAPGPQVALLDVNLGGTQVFPVADFLEERGIPLIFSTAYDASILPERYRERDTLEKPLLLGELLRVLDRVCPDQGDAPQNS